MPLKNKPTRSEIINRQRVDVKTELPKSDPYSPTGTINAELVAFGSRFHELYEVVENLAVNRFVTTMTDEDSIIEAGNELGLTQNVATGSQGVVIFTGTTGTTIPQGSELTAEGNTYTTDLSATISTKNISVSSITRSGSTVTVNTSDVHSFGSGMEITISGANETDYNGDFIITVTDADTFTYTISATPATPATGTIVASCDCASINVTSSLTGKVQNLIAGTQLSLSATISGIDSAVYTDYLGIDGGADQETIAEFQKRIIFTKQNPNTHFNKTEIINKAKEITGVTRVFVYSPDDLALEFTPVTLSASNEIVTATFSSSHGLENGSPITVTGAVQSDFNGTFPVLVKDSLNVFYHVSSIANGSATGTITVNTPVIEKGQVLIYFVRDNDTNIIPTQAEIQLVKDKILTIKPADINGNFDVIVNAPTAKTQDFNISNLVPDTAGIRNSIETNLKQAFTDNNLGDGMAETVYTSAMQFSFDPETGENLKSFSVDVSGEIQANFNEILVLGDVNIT